jgi:predicted Zn finger-like uncharacterized protein
MIVTCQNCSTRLQLDDAKVPARPFSVRCPKCQQIINAQPPTAQVTRKDAVSAVTDVPVSTRTQQEASASPPAPVFRESPSAASGHGESDLLRVLSSLLRQNTSEAPASKAVAHTGAWERRRVLVCVGPTYCEEVVTAMTANQYVVYIAANAEQAAERMREDHVDVVVLDEEFDAPARGAAAINRALNAMRMVERRRVVFVLVSKTARTGDAHAAFLENVNLVINTLDVAGLPLALEKNVRDLNELYQDFNRALNVAAL